jgi:hypothetical protein
MGRVDRTARIARAHLSAQIGTRFRRQFGSWSNPFHFNFLEVSSDVSSKSNLLNGAGGVLPVRMQQ